MLFCLFQMLPVFQDFSRRGNLRFAEYMRMPENQLFANTVRNIANIKYIFFAFDFCMKDDL